MKNKLFILFSVLFVVLCATTLVACNKYNDERLIANGYTMDYGQSVDFSKFNVAYYKDGETHPLTLKGEKDPYEHYDNPDGDYVWQQVGSSGGESKVLNVDKPDVGLYSIRFEYKRVWKQVTLVVRQVDYPATITLEADESTRYYGDKINVSLSEIPEGATRVEYYFSRYIGIQDGEEKYVEHDNIYKFLFDNLSSVSWFGSHKFHANKYQVYAEIDVPGYNTIRTNVANFEVKKAIIQGKYHFSISTATVEYAGDNISDYVVPNEFYTLIKLQDTPYKFDNTNDSLPWSLRWETPEQDINEFVEGFSVNQTKLIFESNDLALSANSDLRDVTLRVKPATFPFADQTLVIDNSIWNDSSAVELKDSYDINLKVRQRAGSSWINVPEGFVCTLTDFNGNAINGTYNLTAADQARGYIRVNYSIIEQSGHYESCEGSFDIALPDTVYADADNFEDVITYAINRADNQTISVVLVENIQLEESLQLGKNVDLYLGDYTITGANANGAAIEILADATVNIYASEGGVVGGSGADCKTIRCYGVVNIYGGNYTVGPDASGNGNGCIEAWGYGIVNIFDGHFESQAGYYGWYYVLNQKNNATSSQINVYGGTFVNYNPENGDDSLGGNFVANGYHVEENDGVFVVLEGDNE